MRKFVNIITISVEGVVIWFPWSIVLLRIGGYYSVLREGSNETNWWVWYRPCVWLDVINDCQLKTSLPEILQLVLLPSLSQRKWLYSAGFRILVSWAARHLARNRTRFTPQLFVLLGHASLSKFLDRCLKREVKVFLHNSAWVTLLLCKKQNRVRVVWRVASRYIYGWLDVSFEIEYI